MAKSKRSRRRGFTAFLAVLCLMLILAGICRYAVFVPARITTDAMAPAYTAGDVVLIDKFSLWKSFDIQKGDTVYAYFAAGKCRLLRTVAGTEGDYIDMRAEGTYLVGADGQETFLGEDTPGLVCGTLPEGAYLLLSAQDGALDSRELGLVYKTDILGFPYKIIIDR